MKRTLYFIILFFFLSYFTLNAQQHINIMNAFNHYKLKASNDYNKLAFHIRNSIDKKVIGNVYPNDWEEAILIINKEEIYSVEARHRVFDDELQILLDGQIKAIYPHLIKGVAFKDRSIVSGVEEKEDGLTYQFYTLLSGGRIELLRKDEVACKIQDDNIIKLGKTKTTLYFRKNGAYVEKLNTSPQKLLPIFEFQKDKVQTFIKQKKLSTHSEEDLKLIFQFYNRLE